MPSPASHRAGGAAVLQQATGEGEGEGEIPCPILRASHALGSRIVSVTKDAQLLNMNIVYQLTMGTGMPA